METNSRKHSRWLMFAGIGFVVTIIMLLILGVAFGGLYKRKLSDIVGQPQISELTSIEVKKIKKVTFQKRNTSSCIEVIPDGIVRIYTVCGEELDSAYRLDQNRNINKLFKTLQEKDFKSKRFSDTDEVYQVTLETETGTEIFYIVIGSDDEGEELLEIIEDIQEDIPRPSPSWKGPSTSGDGSSPFPSTAPSVGQNPSASPSPTPTSGPVLTFTCEFTESGGSKRPYNVSNVICTSEPSPAP